MLYKTELAQIGWVVPDIPYRCKISFQMPWALLATPAPEHVRAQDLNMSYYGKVVAGNG